jgi:hypothetical protein
MTAAGLHAHVFRTGAEQAFARAHLEPLADRRLTPEVVRWEASAVVMRAGLPLTEWLRTARPSEVTQMRPKALALVHGIHALGVCHRDLHVENVVVVDGLPMAIDFEHACEVDPVWPCYDLTGPSEQVPLLPAHAKFGGVLGSHGIWWDGPRDDRWLGRYVPLGMVFGPVDSAA